MKKIRNFLIIAHIDHGKSTLADRILEFTGAIPQRQMRQQVLDQMELEREHGVTIKAKSIQLEYRGHLLNLIDTPGHVDFGYEVSRSLAACEGAVLVVDAGQGVEAQTVANLRLAREQGLTIVPVINKIDLPAVDIEAVQAQMENILDLPGKDIILASAKQGIGTDQVLEAIIEKVPPPSGDPIKPLKAFILDAVYDQFRGVIMCLRIIDGEIKPGMKVKLISSGKDYSVEEVGIFKLERFPRENLQAGEVGYLIAGVKHISDIQIGDTVIDGERPAPSDYKGIKFKKTKPLVFCGMYPISFGDYENLRGALGKLRLTDSSFSYLPEESSLFGAGFRCGFLGLFHMEIIKERLEQEYNLDLILSTPNVLYRITKKNGERTEIENLARLPPLAEIQSIEQPYVKVTNFLPSPYIGQVMDLVKTRGSVDTNLNYLNPTRVIITAELPLAEMMVDFNDRLKSITKGYGSFDYQLLGFRKSDLVRLDVLINRKPVEGLCFLVPRVQAPFRAHKLAEKLAEVIPRHQFEIPVQARVNNKIIARQDIRALRKDVTAPLYGGDVTRKIKLLEKQKRGKRKMKQVGKVNIPGEAFLAMLKIGE